MLLASEAYGLVVSAPISAQPLLSHRESLTPRLFFDAFVVEVAFTRSSDKDTLCYSLGSCQHGGRKQAEAFSWCLTSTEAVYGLLGTGRLNVFSHGA